MAINLTGYARPALHFSGGKDSLAVLYLMRDQLDDVPVYWLNTGDGCPETLEVVERVRQWIPRFIEIRSDSKMWRTSNGDPSDIVPALGHEIAVAYGMNDIRISNRFDCCLNNIMLPLHERMIQDKIDVVIKGTKKADTGRVPHEGWGPVYDVILPIRDWSHDQVCLYLKKVGAPINPIYEYATGVSAPECFSCTAWWDDGKAAYYAARHPKQLEVYRQSLSNLRDILRTHVRQLNQELGER